MLAMHATSLSLTRVAMARQAEGVQHWQICGGNYLQE